MVLSLCCLGGALFFRLSTVYHTLANHSREVHGVGYRLDLLDEVRSWLDILSSMACSVIWKSLFILVVF